MPQPFMLAAVHDATLLPSSRLPRPFLSWQLGTGTEPDNGIKEGFRVSVYGYMCAPELKGRDALSKKDVCVCVWAVGNAVFTQRTGNVMQHVK